MYTVITSIAAMTKHDVFQSRHVELAGINNVKLPSIATTTHQRVARLVLVDCAHSCPVELLEQLEAWCVECVLTWHHAEEVREVLLREHRVRVCV